jgi:hypothetical protein
MPQFHKFFDLLGSNLPILSLPLDLNNRLDIIEIPNCTEFEQLVLELDFGSVSYKGCEGLLVEDVESRGNCFEGVEEMLEVSR